VTLHSDFAERDLSGSVTGGKPATRDGQTCIPIEGRTPVGSGKGTAHATFYVTTGHEPLPIAFTAGTASIRTTTTWSRWGHAVTLRAPHDAVPIASLSN
jgi:hypothetical protein